VASYTYDGAGRLATTTDPLGRTDSLFYDGADRLTRQVLPGGREIGFAYDSSGNLTSVTPPSQPAHGFTYTALDLDSVYAPPSVGVGTWSTQYRYDLDRQLTRILRPGGDSIVLSYEALTGRPSTVTFDRGTLSFGYSGATGQLTSLTGPASTI
jgi:YD repeat-containing protein